MLAFTLALLALALAACVRPLERDDAAELEHEATAVFKPTTESAPESVKPTEATQLPTAEIQEMPTQQPEPEPTAIPEPTPISSSIVITTPIEGSLLDITDVITVSGTGEGLPEGNVAVQVKDFDGNIMAMTATTLSGENAGLGGAGKWKTTISISELPGEQGSIYAFSSSPADGSVLAEDSIGVSFIESAREPFVEINTPGMGEQLVVGPILVSGRGGGLFEGSVVVQAEDSHGRILLIQPTILQGNNVGLGGSGTWETTLSLRAFPGSQIKIVAYSTSPEDGSVIASANIDVIYGVLSGSVIHIVQLGENLFRISLQYGVSMDAIMAANGLPNVDQIYEGQQLIIPTLTQ
jgi:hypothetical protein